MFAASWHTVNTGEVNTVGPVDGFTVTSAVAEVVPHVANMARSREEIFERLGDWRMPGDGFADDLGAIQKEQSLAVFPEWPS